VSEGKADLYTKGKKATPEMAIHLADLLERLGQHPSQVQIRREFVRQAGIQKGDRVLDVGSGTGVLTREIPPLIGEMGHVIGVDPNYRLVETARKLAKEKGLSGKVSFCMGEGEVINFSADNAYHVTLSSQLFSHVADPGQILYEMIRVTKPGGKVAILDYDFSTYSTSHPDREVTDQLLRYLLQDYLICPSGFRTLPPLFAELGLEQIQIGGWVHLEREPEGPITLFLQEVSGSAVQKGIISASSAAGWREGQIKQASAGGFYGALTYLGLFGVKPAI
jgi:ubiquinone/menaquinone biosynthesis C-methylase UbiE